MGLRPDDRHLAVIPLGHSYGLGNLVMPLLLQASGIRVCAAPFPHSVAAAIAAGRVTVLPAVPALCAALARSSVPASALASLRLVISAGSPLDPGDARAFLRRFGRRIHNFYGSTETGGIAYDASGDDTLSGDAVGQPLADVRATIDRTGRLLVVSAAVYRRGNRARHAGLGAFRMPDSVTLREDGALRLHGRRTAFIKVAGKRLNPAEVSRAIHALEGVQAAYVAPYTDGNGRIRLAAAVAAARPLPALRSALRRRLAAWKLPARWLCLDALPLNSRGKVDYARLRRDLTRADTA
jgi:acyl-coenzyme A synthetase/AMP-(fatty) acid ligase